MMTDAQLPPRFQGILDNNEKVLWLGKPVLFPFLLTGVPFLIFGLIWGLLDSSFIVTMMKSPRGGPPGEFIFPFFLLHLAPCWLSILNMIRLFLVHPNTFYAITNKRLLYRSGFWGTDFKSVDYDKIQEIEVAVNPIWNMLGVGTVKAFTGATGRNNGFNFGDGGKIYDKFLVIQNPYDVYKMIKQVSVDIKTDWNFPNKLRPEENPGYNSDYKRKSE